MARIPLFTLCLCLGLLATPLRSGAAPPAPALPPDGTVALIGIAGPIGPATSLYYRNAAGQAEARGDRLIILRVDTPGGLDEPMRDIIKRIQSSRIPVVVYVAPSGARAASAGTYLLYAGHVAAMAPATNLGAATPIPVMGAEPEPGADAERDPRDDNSRPDAAHRDRLAQGRARQDQPRAPPPGAAARKAVNDATAYLRSLAEQRGRNAEWAELAVRDGASLSADAALKLKVIDLIARDNDDLLRQLDGRRIPWPGGSLVLRTANVTVNAIEPTWREQFLGVITSPTVAYLLMLIGFYGLLMEGFSPGAILPGVAGGICLLLALYAFQLLPINYAGLALLALGLALIVAETLVPGVGLLGIGGVIALITGSILLLDSDVPGYRVPPGVVAGTATTAGLVMLLSLRLLLRTGRRPPVQALAGLAHAEAEALEDFQDEGWVEVEGERWRARSPAPVRRGQRLRIAGLRGLVLELVAPATEPESRNT